MKVCLEFGTVASIVLCSNKKREPGRCPAFRFALTFQLVRRAEG